ncbi:MAG: hypothetical protein JXK08_06875 [Flavobacteriaceae bacterium]|nr:hypothetical protein [Flavobacteriaceae bacterium]
MMYFNRLLLVLFCVSVWSCSSDDDTNNVTKNPNALIGEWLRSDFDNTYEHRIHFEDNDFGYTADKHITTEGITSTAISFNWSVNDNTITIAFDNYTIISDFSFTEDGNLIISELSALEFIKQ